MNRHAMTKPLRLSAPLFALLLAACLPDGEVAVLRGTDFAGATIGGPFELVNAQGQPVRWDDFAGRYRIVYFGYAFCPDVCPTDVATIMQGYRKFAAAHPDRATKVQPIFITIDPARDTPAKVGEFAAAFGAPLIGLTGSEAQVRQAANAFRVYYAKGETSANGYLMDHTRLAYLMGPDGAPIEGLPVEQGAEAVAADLAIAVQ